MKWVTSEATFHPSDLDPPRIYARKGFALPMELVWGKGAKEDSVREARLKYGTEEGSTWTLGDVLVTGGAGELGSRLVRILADRDDVRSITVASRSPAALDAMIAANCGAGAASQIRESGKVRHLAVDLSDEGSRQGLETAMRQTNHVFHLAAAMDAFAPSHALEGLNVGATQRIVEACLATGTRLTLASTLSVFVSSNGFGEAAETTIGRDRDAVLYGGYAQTKARSEAIVALATLRGLNARTVRLGLLVPEEGAPLRDGHFAKTFTRALAKAGCVPDGAREALVDLTPTDQAAEALAAITASGMTGTFHYANPESGRLSDFAEGVDATLRGRPRAVGLRRVGDAQWEREIAALPSIPAMLLKAAFKKAAFLEEARAMPILNVDLFQSTGRRFGITRSLQAGAPTPRAPEAQIEVLVQKALARERGNGDEAEDGRTP